MTTPNPDPGPPASARARPAHGLLDGVLAEVALPSPEPWVPVLGAARVAASLVGHPRRTATSVAAFAGRLGRILADSADEDPARDRRFRDSAWSGNPLLRRTALAYLALNELVDDMISAGGLDWRAERRVRLASRNVLAALAPTNNPMLNPTVLKAVVDSGGGSLLRGVRNLTGDLLRPGSALRLPSMVDPQAFTVGGTLAATPGAVVARTDMVELLQYRPTTDTVRDYPVVVVPSTINKFYIFDLAPGRSAIEHAVRAGHQVFALSWREPGAEQAGWGLARYAAAVVEALGTVRAVTRADRCHLVGLCAGGLVTTVVAAHLAAIADARLASLTNVVSVLDHRRPGDVTALVDADSAALAVAESARRGYIDGEALAGVFAWLRPEDRIWRYWVQNYLLGQALSANDILFWNADTVNLAAGFHRDLLRLAVDNGLAASGSLDFLGTPVDLRRVAADTYLVAGLTDHITPWQSCFRSTGLLGGACRFVLVNTGHVTTVVSPPGDERAAYWAAAATAADEPNAWRTATVHNRGSWWEDWTAWLHERGGQRHSAPDELGSAEHPPLGPAPGSYVRGAAR